MTNDLIKENMVITGYEKGRSASNLVLHSQDTNRRFIMTLKHFVSVAEHCEGGVIIGRFEVVKRGSVYLLERIVR